MKTSTTRMETNVAKTNEAEMTIADAMEIVVKEQARKEKKREALKKWRTAHKSEYNEYIKDWHAKRKLKVAEAQAILNANK